MALVQTYDGTVHAVDGVVKTGCCCGNCCLEPGGPPTADFSYSQSDNDPCCFTFTNSSTIGSCGSIVSYLWDFGDGETSTSTNPTHCYDAEDAGPWNVTLTVTDTSGCEDSAVMEVLCSPNPCECCDEEFLPLTALVTISGTTENVVRNDCDACPSINGTHTLTSSLTGVFCHYQKVFSISTCRGGATNVTLTLVFCQFVGNWRVTQVIDGGQTDYWELDALSNCRGTHAFNLVFSGGIDRVCNVPATITVVI